jgi:hypothetical protein
MQITLLAVLLMSGQATQDEAYAAAYEQSFRSAYRTRFIQECVSSAGAAGAQGVDVTPICACVSEKLLATKSVNELSQKPSDAELGTLANECIKTHPPSRLE